MASQAQGPVGDAARRNVPHIRSIALQNGLGASVFDSILASFSSMVLNDPETTRKGEQYAHYKVEWHTWKWAQGNVPSIGDYPFAKPSPQNPAPAPKITEKPGVNRGFGAGAGAGRTGGVGTRGGYQKPQMHAQFGVPQHQPKPTQYPQPTNFQNQHQKRVQPGFVPQYQQPQPKLVYQQQRHPPHAQTQNLRIANTQQQPNPTSPYQQVPPNQQRQWYHGPRPNPPYQAPIIQQTPQVPQFSVMAPAPYHASQYHQAQNFQQAPQAVQQPVAPPGSYQAPPHQQAPATYAQQPTIPQPNYFMPEEQQPQQTFQQQNQHPPAPQVHRPQQPHPFQPQPQQPTPHLSNKPQPSKPQPPKQTPNLPRQPKTFTTPHQPHTNRSIRSGSGMGAKSTPWTSVNIPTGPKNSGIVKSQPAAQGIRRKNGMQNQGQGKVKSSDGGMAVAAAAAAAGGGVGEKSGKGNVNGKKAEVVVSENVVVDAREVAKAKKTHRGKKGKKKK